jgi:hypothetical protein
MLPASETQNGDANELPDEGLSSLDMSTRRLIELTVSWRYSHKSPAAKEFRGWIGEEGVEDRLPKETQTTTVDATMELS